jgi:hypothetical protein
MFPTGLSGLSHFQWQIVLQFEDHTPVRDSVFRVDICLKIHEPFALIQLDCGDVTRIDIKPKEWIANLEFPGFENQVGLSLTQRVWR